MVAKLKQNSPMHQSGISTSFKDSLKNTNLEDFLTYSFCIIDDIFQTIKHFVERPGPACKFYDSEVICLNLIGQMVTDSENSWHVFVQKNYLKMFPNLIERSGTPPGRYHRRCKDLQQITELLFKQFSFAY